MQTLKARLSKLSGRNWNVLLYLLVMGIGGSIVTSWARSLVFFFLLPFQMCMVCAVVRNKTLHRTGLFWIATAFVLWMFLVYVINDRWNASGMIVLLAMLMCWYAALFVPEETELRDVHRELFGIGLVFIIGYMPFMLLAMLSIYTGRLMPVPFDEFPVGIQTAGSIGDRIRVLGHPNGVARFAVFNVLFSIYGILTHKKKAWRGFLSFAILLNVLVLAHTQSRTGYITLGLGLGIIVFRAVFIALREKKCLRFLVAALAAILVFFAIVYGMEGVLKLDTALAKQICVVKPEKITFRAEEIDMFNTGMSGRNKIWGSALKYLKDNPKCLVLGIGSHSSVEVLGREYAILAKFNLHSSYMDVLTHCGIPGLLLVFAFLLMLIRPAWNTLLTPCTEESRGLFILPVLVVVILVMGFTEIGLYISADYTNYLLMAVCGLMLRYAKLQARIR